MKAILAESQKGTTHRILSRLIGKEFEVRQTEDNPEYFDVLTAGGWEGGFFKYRFQVVEDDKPLDGWLTP